MKHSKAKRHASLGITSHPGSAKNGSNTEWIIGAGNDVMSVGKGKNAYAIAAVALTMLIDETAAIPTGAQARDRHVRQWMLKIAVHKAAIRVGRPFPSVAMHYLIETTDKWKATIAETARQLLKHGELPKNYETPS